MKAKKPPNKNKRERPPAGLDAVCKILGTEGFSPYAEAAIRNYYKRRMVNTDRQRQQIEQIEQVFRELIKDWDIGARLVLGKFIGFRSKASFEAGLRIGMTAVAYRNLLDENETHGQH